MTDGIRNWTRAVYTGHCETDETLQISWLLMASCKTIRCCREVWTVIDTDVVAMALSPPLLNGSGKG